MFSSLLILVVTILLCNTLDASTIRHGTRAPTEEPPYCYLNSGCSVMSDCQCPTTFMYCETKVDPNGVCLFTTAGVLGLSAILIGSVLAVVFFFCFCCCCCRGRGDTHHHTTINYPTPTYTGHNQL